MNISDFKKDTLVLICAKGNSKGLKEKNLKLFFGKSLLRRAIQKAKFNNFNYICLSTESDKVIKVASKSGLKVFFKRSKKLTLTNISKEEVWKDAITKSEKYFNKKFKYFLDIEVTNPLLTKNDLKKFIKIAYTKLLLDWNGIYYITDSRKNPYFNIFEKNTKRGFKTCLNLKFKKIRSRQTAPKTFDHVAGFYYFKTKYLKSEKNFLFDKKIFGLKIPFFKSYDIDSIDDFNFVKIIYKNYIRI
mgnify:CR=1 FL=1|tara:strand:+ start:220 stop:954 length:735 start_codon:yes stop_codon:yes gene_type:complete